MKAVITNEVFSDFLQCRYRAYLKLTGATGQVPQPDDLHAQLLQDYRTKARQYFLRANRDKKVNSECVSLPAVLAKRYDLAVDVTATQDDMILHFDALLASPGATKMSVPGYVPVMFVLDEKVRKENKLQLAFCASVLAHQQANAPPFGRIVHGPRFTSTTIQLGTLLTEVGNVVQKIRALERANAPPTITAGQKLSDLRVRCQLSGDRR